MKDEIRVLIVEDSEADAFLLERALAEGGYKLFCKRVDTEASMTDALVSVSWDIIIADFSMPSFSGLRALSVLQKFDVDIPFILVSGTIGEELAVEAMKSGANDCIMKTNLGRLVPAVKRAIEQAESRSDKKKALATISQMNERLIKANEELRSIDSMKTSLLANVSHELRTPIVSIRGYTELMLSGHSGPLSEEQTKHLSISLRNIDKLMMLIDNLLEFSAVSAETSEIAGQKIDIVNIIRQVWNSFAEKLAQKNLTGALDLYNEEVSVFGSSPQLCRVFNNLIDNAIKFTASGGAVSVSMAITDASVIVVITDTGQGMPQNVLNKIFDHFFQVDFSSTRRFGGIGIGLTLSKVIIDKHGGKISVDSKEGFGSKFTVTLPRVN